jgi:hypothetical protein
MAGQKEEAAALQAEKKSLSTETMDYFTLAHNPEPAIDPGHVSGLLL